MNNRNYLVVDEALTVTRRTRTFLEQIGVPRDRILEACSADEAMDIFRRNNPEVVLLSLTLPDRSGHVVAEEMWNHDPGARIVLVTAAGRGDERVREALRSGVHAVLQKPIRESDIRDLDKMLSYELQGRDRIPPPAERRP